MPCYSMPRLLHFHFRPKHNVGDAAVVLAVRQLVGRALPGARWNSLPMKALREPPGPSLLQFINRHDAVIIGGGGFCSKFALPVDPDLVAGITPPVALFGVGYNRHLAEPGLDDRQRESLALVGHKARLVGVRDTATRDLFASLGVAARLTGDPALFLDAGRPWWPPRCQRTRAIGINLACHGWTGQDGSLDGLLALYREVLRPLLAEQDAEPWYMVHTDSEGPAIHALRRDLPGLRVVRYPAAKLRWAYGQLDLVLSMMLHSALLAFAAGVPVVNVAYDEKSRAFLEDIGQSGRCLPASTATAGEVLAACRAALAEPDTERMQAARQDYATQTAAFTAELAALCGRGA